MAEYLKQALGLLLGFSVNANGSSKIRKYIVSGFQRD